MTVEVTGVKGDDLRVGKAVNKNDIFPVDGVISKIDGELAELQFKGDYISAEGLGGGAAWVDRVAAVREISELDFKMKNEGVITGEPINSLWLLKARAVGVKGIIGIKEISKKLDVVYAMPTVVIEIREIEEAYGLIAGGKQILIDALEGRILVVQ